MRERLRQVLEANGVGPVDASLHSWRCEHPDRYGECTCFAELLDDLEEIFRPDDVPCEHTWRKFKTGIRKYRHGALDFTYETKCTKCGERKSEEDVTDE